MDRAPTRALIVEDHAVTQRLVAGGLRRVAATAGRAVEVATLDHAQFEAATPDPVPDVVLIDLFRSWVDCARDPLLPMLAGPWIAQRAARWRPLPRLIGYSAGGPKPELTVPFLQVHGTLGFYQVDELVAHLDEALWSPTLDHATTAVTDDDLRALGLEPGAQVFRALEVARQRPDAWEVIARPTGYVIASGAVRRFINEKVAPLLPLTDPGNYKRTVAKLREIASFTGGPSPT